MRNEKDELPDNFLHELYKWALECESGGGRVLGTLLDKFHY